MAAAGQTKLVLIAVKDRQWTQWDFGDLDATPRTGKLEINGDLKSVALGDASDGPLAIYWESARVAKPTATNDWDRNFGLFDLATMQPIKFPVNSGVKPRRNSAEITSTDGSCICQLRTPPISISASCRGNFFVAGKTALQLYPDALVATQIEPSLRLDRILPSADSKLLLTSDGVFSADFKTRSLSGDLVPTCNGRFALRFSKAVADDKFPTQGEVVDLHTFRSVVSLPEMPEMKKVVGRVPIGAFRKTDNRYFLCAAVALLGDHSTDQ